MSQLPSSFKRPGREYAKCTCQELSVKSAFTLVLSHHYAFNTYFLNARHCSRTFSYIILLNPCNIPMKLALFPTLQRRKQA